MLFQSLYGFRNRNNRRENRRTERGTVVHARMSSSRAAPPLPPYVKPALILTLGLLCAGGVAYGAHVAGRTLCRQNDRFLVTDIDLPPNLTLPRDLVLEKAGINVGDNLFKLTPAEIRANLLAVPAIKAAEVTRQLPGRIGISLQVREPAARVGQDNGFSLIVDPEGMVFTKSARHKGLPLILGVNPVSLKFGESILNEHTRDAFEVLRILEQRRLTDVLPVKIIYVALPDILDIRLHSNQQLKLPRNQLENGLQNLAAAIQKDQELRRPHSVYTATAKNTVVAE